MAERSANNGLQQMEDLRRSQCEFSHTQLVVEKDRGDLGGLEQVLEIGVRPAELLDPVRELAVDGLQLLVGRLKLFLGGLHLLIGGFQFLDPPSGTGA